jgi:hypothetical protein
VNRAAARALLGLLVLGACGHKPGGAHDAAVATGDAATLRAIDGGVVMAPDDAGAGPRVVVHVEWKDAPAAVRASPGLDACDDPRPGFARVHTLEGVADVVVWVDEPGVFATTAKPTITVRRCHLEPGVLLADKQVRVSSAIGDRVDVELKSADAIGDVEPKDVLASFTLPVIGHTTAVEVKPGVVAVTTSASVDPAYVVIPPSAVAAVTDDTGDAVLTGLAPGDHPVIAWLHGGAGQPAKTARGTVTVKAGEKATLTLSLATGGAVASPSAASAADAGADEPEP